MTVPGAITRFLAWWRAPVTARDRALGAVIGAFAGFWVGFFCCIALGPATVSGTDVLVSGAAGVVVFALLGATFPKAATVVLFPVATIGPG